MICPPFTALSAVSEVLKDSLVDWTSRIADGEVPPAPPRPTGVERNVVITQWAWGQELSYIHDNVSTDKRDPTLYPGGPIYGGGGAGLVVTDIATRQRHALPVPPVNLAGDRDAGALVQCR